MGDNRVWQIIYWCQRFFSKRSPSRFYLHETLQKGRFCWGKFRRTKGTRGKNELGPWNLLGSWGNWRKKKKVSMKKMKMVMEQSSRAEQWSPSLQIYSFSLCTCDLGPCLWLISDKNRAIGFSSLSSFLLSCCYAKKRSSVALINSEKTQLVIWGSGNHGITYRMEIEMVRSMASDHMQRCTRSNLATAQMSGNQLGWCIPR